LKRLLVVISIFAVHGLQAQRNSDVIDYINTYKEIAIREMQRSGIPASITLAQGIHESMAGKSDLVQKSNNHFGIKCRAEWKGEKVYHDDDARGECFRSYTKAEESYVDHSDFLRNGTRYAFLFEFDPTEYSQWAYGLKKAGYATNPAYANMVINIIADNNLQEYTLIALERSKNNDQGFAVNNNMPVISTMNKGAADDNMLIENQNNNTIQEPLLTEYSEGDAYPTGFFTINHAKVMYASAGTSLFALASNNNIAFKKLLEYNDLGNVDIINQSQLIFLERKPKKSEVRDYHIVASAETIEEIAQKEGVQLESLFEYNKMQKGLQPATGEKVYLHPGKPSYYPRLLAKNSVK
jgi:hypothetical protein